MHRSSGLVCRRNGLCEWDPQHDGEWQAVLDDKDAVVQLAGEVLVGRRYTEELKNEF